MKKNISLREELERDLKFDRRGTIFFFTAWWLFFTANFFIRSSSVARGTMVLLVLTIIFWNSVLLTKRDIRIYEYSGGDLVGLQRRNR